MNAEQLRLPLLATDEQAMRLGELQRSFAEVCNTLAPVVQERRLWNRVTLHHLMYRPLREQFPALGSQMVCNAIHAVCRGARLVYQHPASPFSLTALQGAPLPLLRFRESSPVYFDRHTSSLKEGVVSLYTLQGRIHCLAALGPGDEARFQEGRLREVVMQRNGDDGYELLVSFVGSGDPAKPARRAASGPLQIPQYLQIGARP